MQGLKAGADTLVLPLGAIVNGLLKALTGIRLDAEAEFNGADLSIHKVSATPD